MMLTFAYTLSAGEGIAPQAIHVPDGRLRIIYLDEDGTVHCRDATPTLGLYDNLEFRYYSRVSQDKEVSLPSLKKVAHYGGYGFWSADGDHRFVMYMLPEDISDAIVDGSVQASANEDSGSCSLTLINSKGKLINRRRSLLTPGTKLELFYTQGGGEEIYLGVYHIDRASVSFPEQNISVSARDTVGKLLKEQTFDENTTWNEGSTHDNLEAILRYAGVESFFAGDPGTDGVLEFDPDTTVLEGLKYAITTLAGWKIAQNPDGRVGVAEKTDGRFEQPGVFNFRRDHTCWSYSVEYDDSNGAARVCVYSNPAEEGAQVMRAYATVGPNRFWAQPEHRTLYVQTVDGAALSQIQDTADGLAQALAISGRTETFAGIFTPELVLGDEVRITEEGGETVGSVTDFTHSFGRSGFTTAFTADSGGRRGKQRLKDMITTAADFPETFTGAHKMPSEVTLMNKLSLFTDRDAGITATFNTGGGILVLAFLLHRTAVTTPSGWYLLTSYPGFTDGDLYQFESVYFKFTSAAEETVFFSKTDAEDDSPMYLNLVSLANAGIPYVAVAHRSVNARTLYLNRGTSDTVLWAVQRITWSEDDSAWSVDGAEESHVVQREKNGLLLNVVDGGKRKTLTVSETGNLWEPTDYFAVGVPNV